MVITKYRGNEICNLNIKGIHSARWLVSDLIFSSISQLYYTYSESNLLIIRFAVTINLYDSMTCKQPRVIPGKNRKLGNHISRKFYTMKYMRNDNKICNLRELFQSWREVMIMLLGSCRNSEPFTVRVSSWYEFRYCY